MSRAVPRVVIAGLGDSGLLTAIRLAGAGLDVVGISVKPGLVSGQELGLRLARPDVWARDYWLPFGRFRRLDGVRTVHGELTGLNRDRRTVHLRRSDGTETDETFDVLVIATGVSNGFWRRPTLQSAGDIDAELEAHHRRVLQADAVAVVGGGASAVSTAFNLGAVSPEQRIDLFFPGERALTQHHPRVWDALRERLDPLGVGIHPGHRAELPADPNAISAGPIRWTTGQPETPADTIIWAVGQARPNTGWLPSEWLDERGFVRVDEHLRVAGLDHVYAIGDVAATGPLRNSARGRADGLLARNVRAGLAGKSLRPFREAPLRWGSVVGPQDNVLEVFAPNGRPFRIRGWTRWQPLLVRRAIYKGIRPE